MSIRKREWTTAKGENKTAWVVNYTDSSGKRRLKTFPTQRAARNYEAEAHLGVRAGTHTADSVSVSVAKATELWIDHCRAEGLEVSTIKQREQHLALHIRPYIGTLKLSALTAPRVVKWLDELRDAGRSVAMRHKVLTNLKTVLSFAQGRGLVAQNVARGVKVRQSRREAESDVRAGVDMPTKAELRALIDHAPARWRPFILTAIFTGMRASELRGLRWDDVDFKGGQIDVRQRVDLWGNAGAPKSAAGRRSIPMASIVANALKEWKLACPRGEAGLVLVFPNGAGNPESHQNIIKRVFNPLQVAAGIVDPDGKPKYGLHSLRHAAASMFIEQGWTPKKIQSVLGHSTIQMTFDRYGKLFADDEGDRAAMDRVEAALLAG